MCAAYRSGGIVKRAPPFLCLQGKVDHQTGMSAQERGGTALGILTFITVIGRAIARLCSCGDTAGVGRAGGRMFVIIGVGGEGDSGRCGICWYARGGDITLPERGCLTTKKNGRPLRARLNRVWLQFSGNVALLTSEP